MAIKSVFYNTGSGQAIELKLDTAKYDAALLTATGGTLTAPAGANIYPYRSIRAALKTAAIQRLRVIVKNGKKLRTITVVCDKDKIDTVRGELINQSIKVGGVTKIDWTVEKVEGY